MLSHRNIAELGQLAEALGLRETLDPANHAGSRDRAAVHAYRIALVYIISASLFSMEIYFQNNGNTIFFTRTNIKAQQQLLTPNQLISPLSYV